MKECIDKDLRTLEANAEMRADMMPALTLEHFMENVVDVTTAIQALIDGATRVKDAEKPVRDLVSKVIAEATEGRLAVVEYSQRAMSKQDIYVYVGTHWMKVHTQLYFDFVKDGARRAGLMECYVEDQDFMNKVFEQVAFRVARSRMQVVPKNEVWMNFMNGTLIITDEGDVWMREHRREDFFRYVLPYCYNPEAVCPMWHTFLNRVMPDESMQTLLAEYIGYCFTKNLKLEKMAVFYGIGSNGKSVTMDVIESLVGSQNVSNISLGDVTMNDEKRALIENKLVNISSESGRELDHAMLKKLVSGEAADVRILYKGTHTMHSYAKFITSYNRLPSSETTVGYFRRWILFPYSVSIGEEEQDVDLVKKLRTELSGILNWVLEALKGLVARKAFTKCEVCETALNEYKKSSNSAILFLDERCKVVDGGMLKLKDLYDAYGRFCREEDIYNKYKKSTFREILKNYGATCTTYQGIYFYNIKFKDYECEI